MIGWIDNQLAAAIAELAKELPVGHLYANGTGFIPTVKRPLYRAIGDGSGGKLECRSQWWVARLPGDWDEIEPGQLVIANEGPGYGWWNAIVIEVNGDMLTPHWRDFPWQENVVQHRSAVALIRPSA